MPASIPASTRTTWGLVGSFGLAFVITGGVSTFSTIRQMALGNVEWEFGAISSFFDTFPLLGLGLAFVLASGLAGGRRWTVRWLALACFLVAVVMVLLAILYITDVPLALKAAGGSTLTEPLQKAVAKTGAQILLYPISFLAAGVWSWRKTMDRHPA